MIDFCSFVLWFFFVFSSLQFRNWFIVRITFSIKIFLVQRYKMFLIACGHPVITRLSLLCVRENSWFCC